MHGQLKREALAMLPQLFHLSEAHVQRLMEALAELVNDAFPSSSHDLQAGSTQDTEYRRLLLLVMSGAVRAAEDKKDVSTLLEVGGLNPLPLACARHQACTTCHSLHCFTTILMRHLLAAVFMNWLYSRLKC